jgi:alanyl-tRNA synthetase
VWCRLDSMWICVRRNPEAEEWTTSSIEFCGGTHVAAGVIGAVLVLEKNPS